MAAIGGTRADRPGRVTPPGILVVDDEPLIRGIVSETLRDAGYQVWEASEGHAALAIMQGGCEIGLLFTDIRMPGMNGYQLVDASLTLRPNLKVLMMTGYAQGAIPTRFADAGIGVLYKPFDFDTLTSIARELLVASDGSGDFDTST